MKGFVNDVSQKREREETARDGSKITIKESIAQGESDVFFRNAYICRHNGEVSPSFRHFFPN